MSYWFIGRLIWSRHLEEIDIVNVDVDMFSSLIYLDFV